MSNKETAAERKAREAKEREAWEARSWGPYVPEFYQDGRAHTPLEYERDNNAE